MTGRSSKSSLPSDQLRGHLKTMRRSGMILIGLLLVMAVAQFFLPRLANDLVGPMGATVIAAAAALWIGFSANRDAQVRMDRIKRAFAVHGEVDQLLKDYHLAYLAVLSRLFAVAGCGVVVAIWGAGPKLGLAFFILAGILTAMAWPTEHKTQLLVRRARALLPTDD